MPILKAKNSIDLLDFKLKIVGDNSPDDWEEMKRMRSQIEEQSARLAKYETSEAKLSDELKTLRGQLGESLERNDKNEKKIEELEDERRTLSKDNISMK